MSVRLRLSIWTSILLATLTISALSQERAPRVALVIGNAGYPDASTPLPTTINDARTLVGELRRFDFDVEVKEDVGRTDMQRAIDAFVGKIGTGTTALFYFGGFGLQVARENYLIPVDAEIWSEGDVARNGISLDAVLAKMHQKGAKTKIAILDAARQNPFERRFRQAEAGLAALNAPEGTLAIYAAAPDKIIHDRPSANSLFVDELIKELRAPNLSAGEVFNRTRIGVSRASNDEQVPWVMSSLVESFYFGGSGAALAGPAPSPPPNSPLAPAPEPSISPGASPAPSSTVARNAVTPGQIFLDCQDCPELVVVPAGSFDMGSMRPYENPVHHASIAKPFAIGRFEATFAEWDKCVEAGACKNRGDDRGWGRGNRPVINVSWLDAKEFAKWLSGKTGETYRLPSEAEWEYAARGGTKTRFWWGHDLGLGRANCSECNPESAEETLPVGSYQPNPFGLYDTAGNAAEWVEDCWNDNYRGAPGDGSAWLTGHCQLRVLRGGAFNSELQYLRSASRFRYDSDVRYEANGFRLLRELH